MTITGIASMYLLGNLGVEGNENSMVKVVGALGGASIGIAAIINMAMLVRTRNEQQRNATTVELPKQRSDRGFSASDVEEKAVALALV